MLFDDIFRACKDDQIIKVISASGEYAYNFKYKFPLLVWEKIWKYEVQSIYTTKFGTIVVEVIAE